MEPILHLLWTFLIMGQIDYFVLALVVSVLPDVIAFGPTILYNLYLGRRKDLVDDESKQPQALVKYKHRAHHVVHSLVFALPAAVLLHLTTGMLWLYAWPLHVLFDMFTHPKEKATPFLYPISDFAVYGIDWENRRFRIANYLFFVALGIYFFII